MPLGKPGAAVDKEGKRGDTEAAPDVAEPFGVEDSRREEQVVRRGPRSRERVGPIRRPAFEPWVVEDERAARTAGGIGAEQDGRAPGALPARRAAEGVGAAGFLPLVVVFVEVAEHHDLGERLLLEQARDAGGDGPSRADARLFGEADPSDLGLPVVVEHTQRDAPGVELDLEHGALRGIPRSGHGEVGAGAPDRKPAQEPHPCGRGRPSRRHVPLVTQTLEPAVAQSAENAEVLYLLQGNDVRSARNRSADRPGYDGATPSEALLRGGRLSLIGVLRAVDLRIEEVSDIVAHDRDASGAPRKHERDERRGEHSPPPPHPSPPAA